MVDPLGTGEYRHRFPDLAVLAPIRWDLTYADGRGGFVLEMALLVAMPVLAAGKGTPLSYVLTARAVATFLVRRLHSSFLRPCGPEKLGFAVLWHRRVHSVLGTHTPPSPTTDCPV